MGREHVRAMGRTSALVVGAILLLASAPSSDAASSGPRRYKVDATQARWAIPNKREGHYRGYSLEAARYEDLNSGEVFVFAAANRLDCTGDEEGLSCSSSSGSWRTAGGVPKVFEFADDLSRASMRLGPNHAEWVTEDPAEKPVDLIPHGFRREEGCPEGSGTGDGVYRRMRAQGSVFGRALGFDDGRSFAGIARYVLETECHPSGWWTRGRGLPPGAGIETVRGMGYRLGG